MRLLSVRVVLTAIAGTACAAPSIAQQPNLVYANMRNTAGVVVGWTGPGNRQPAMMGGTFSLHTTAQVSPDAPNFADEPVVQPAGAAVWPVRLTLRNSPTVRGLMENVANLPNPVPAYNTLPKVFDGSSTGTGMFAAGTNPRNNLGTLAEANAFFSASRVNNRLVVSSENTSMSVQQDRRVNGSGPAGRAGASVLDPTMYSGVTEGMRLDASVFLPADFSAQVNGEGGYATTTVQVGASLPGFSSGSLGQSHANNPLLFRLNMAVNAFSSSVSVWLDTPDIASAVQFYSPTGVPLSDPAAYVADQLSTHLNFDPSSRRWSLSEELDLFTAESVVSQDATGPVAVDMGVLGEAGIAEVPAPGPIFVALASGVGAIRRQRRPGCPWRRTAA